MLPLGFSAIAVETQLRPLSDGDQLVIKGVSTREGASEPHWYPSKNSAATYVYRTQPGGRSELLRPEGTLHAAFADNGGTTVFYREREIPPERQFVRLPKGEIRPGMTWDVPTISTPPVGGFTRTGYAQCSGADIKYKAVSEPGPSVSIVIDGTPVIMETVRIKYEAYVQACLYTGQWRKTSDILWSPALRWIVQARYVEYTTHHLVNSASGWDIVEIQTAKQPQVSASVSNSMDK